MQYPSIHQIETARLRLRKLRPDDLESYHRHLTSDPEVARYMLWQANPDISHTAAILERRIAAYGKGNRYFWAIAEKEEDSLMGTIALLGFDERANACSFAYMLGKAFWGRGYGTEALKAVFSFAFREMGIESISADHFAKNPASGAVMRKAGMQKTGFLPGQYEKDGVRYDAVQYQITRDHWFKT